MNFFKDENGQIYSGDKISVDDVQLTEDEISVYLVEKHKEAKKSILIGQISFLEQKIQRSAFAKLSGTATDDDNSHFDAYMAQILTLREQIINL